MDSNKVNPAHYKNDTGIDVIEICQAANLDFCMGNALKYLARHGKKEGESAKDDLKKALEYLRRGMQAHVSAKRILEKGAFDDLGEYAKTFTQILFPDSTDATKTTDDLFCLYLAESISGVAMVWLYNSIKHRLDALELKDNQ